PPRHVRAVHHHRSPPPVATRLSGSRHAPGPGLSACRRPRHRWRAQLGGHRHPGQSVNASPTTVQKLAASVPQELARLAAMELDVCTPLAEAPRTADELARALDVRSEMLLPLLRVLVSTGLLCSEAERFKNSAEATQFLVRGQPGYMGGVHELW